MSQSSPRQLRYRIVVKSLPKINKTDVIAAIIIRVYFNKVVSQVRTRTKVGHVTNSPVRVVVDRLGLRSKCQGLGLGQSLSLNPH